MSPEIWAGLIGGFSGVISAWVTSTLTTRGTSAASQRTERRNAQYLAAQVGPVLKDFAATCLSVAYDDGCEEGRPAGSNGECQATVHVCAFKPNDIQGVDWRSLSSELMVDVLTFDEKRNAVLLMLNDWHEYHDPPNHAKFFTDRQFQYAQLGIAAIELGIRLFDETEHTSPLPGAAVLRERLCKRLTEVEVELRAREERLAKYNASGLNEL